MVWLFVLMAIFGSAAATLINRSTLRNVSPVAFAFLNNMLCTLLLLPFALSQLRRENFPDDSRPYMLMAFAAVMWAITASVSMYSHKHTEASVRAPLGQLRLIWMLLLSLLILREPVSILRALGVLIIFFGIFALLWHPEFKFERFRGAGVRWTMLYAFLSAFMAIVDKSIVHYFTPDLYAFLAFLFPTFVLGAAALRKPEEVRFILRNHPRALGMCSVFLSATYYGMIHAYKLLDVSVVYPLSQLSTLLAVLGGIIFLKERAHLRQKIIASVIIIAGSIILKLG